MVARHRHFSDQLLGSLLQLVQRREDVGQCEDSAGVRGEPFVLFAEQVSSSAGVVSETVELT